MIGFVEKYLRMFQLGSLIYPTYGKNIKFLTAIATEFSIKKGQKGVIFRAICRQKSHFSPTFFIGRK
jgi:hypothetical protein